MMNEQGFERNLKIMVLGMPGKLSSNHSMLHERAFQRDHGCSFPHLDYANNSYNPPSPLLGFRSVKAQRSKFTLI